MYRYHCLIRIYYFNLFPKLYDERPNYNVMGVIHMYLRKHVYSLFKIFELEFKFKLLYCYKQKCMIIVSTCFKYIIMLFIQRILDSVFFICAFTLFIDTGRDAIKFIFCSQFILTYGKLCPIILVW